LVDIIVDIGRQADLKGNQNVGRLGNTRDDPKAEVIKQR
jgi:hypothetical protein